MFTVTAVGIDGIVCIKYNNSKREYITIMAACVYMSAEGIHHNDERFTAYHLTPLWFTRNYTLSGKKVYIVITRKQCHNFNRILDQKMQHLIANKLPNLSKISQCLQ